MYHKYVLAMLGGFAVTTCYDTCSPTPPLASPETWGFRSVTLLSSQKPLMYHTSHVCADTLVYPDLPLMSARLRVVRLLPRITQTVVVLVEHLQDLHAADLANPKRVGKVGGLELARIAAAKTLLWWCFSAGNQ